MSVGVSVWISVFFLHVYICPKCGAHSPVPMVFSKVGITWAVSRRSWPQCVAWLGGHLESYCAQMLHQLLFH